MDNLGTDHRRQHHASQAGLKSGYSTRTKCVVAALTLLLGIGLSDVRESRALPAFARKYNADCAMCHYPVYPRLNSFGQQFRRAGYRFPTEFNKEQDFTNIGKNLAARIQTGISYQKLEGAVPRSQVQLDNISLYYAGAVTQHFSAWVRPLFTGTGTTSVQGQLIGFYGNEDRYATFRIGQMNPFQNASVAGFDRPTGISVPSLMATNLTSGVNFSLDKVQKGIELAYVQGPGRLLFEILNGLDQNGSGTASSGDVDPEKDYLVAYEHILDDIASGFTMFYYNGATHGQVTPSLGQLYNFYRTGFSLNKIFIAEDLGFFELQGGYIRSSDHLPGNRPATPGSPGNTRFGNAYYLETQQFFLGPEWAFYERYSVIDQDLDRPQSTRKDYTVGSAIRAETFGKITAEYTYTKNEIPGGQFVFASGYTPTGHSATVQLQLAW
ncbi:MAG: hypothetical protein FJ246_06680 [Nitrospira sp.]|nr:hypothetical protein [Nitrospira sp.]